MELRQPGLLCTLQEPGKASLIFRITLSETALGMTSRPREPVENHRLTAQIFAL